MLRRQLLRRHHVEHLLRVVPLAHLGHVRSSHLRILLVVPLLKGLHELRLGLLHEVLDLDDVHLDGAVLLEGIAVLLLRLLQSPDERILLLVDELLVATLVAPVRLLPGEGFLGVVDGLLRGVRVGHGVPHLRPLLLQLGAVLLEGPLERLALPRLPVGEGDLLVRGRLPVARRGPHRPGGVADAALAVVALVARVRLVLASRAGGRRREADADAPLLGLPDLALAALQAALLLGRVASGLVAAGQARGAHGGPVRELRLQLLVELAEDAEGLVREAEAVDLEVLLPLEVHLDLVLQRALLVRGIVVVRHGAPVPERVVHGQLLLQVLDLALVLLDEQVRVEVDVDGRLVGDTHHPGREAQGAGGLLKHLRLGPDVGDHCGLAVASDGVLQHVRQLRLPVRHVVAVLVAQGHHHLLQERERLVDVGRLLQRHAVSARLLNALAAGKVDEMELGVDDLLLRLHARAALDVDGEDDVGPRRPFVQRVLRDVAVRVALEEDVQRLLLRGRDRTGEASHLDVAARVLDDLHVAGLLRHADVRQEVEHQLVVDLGVGEADGDHVLGARGGLGVDHRDRAGHDAAVLEAHVAAGHRVRLARAGLPIGHDGPVVAVHHGADHVHGAEVEDLLLRGVPEDLVQLEVPALLLVVHHAVGGVLGLAHVDAIGGLIELEVRTEVRRGPGPHDDAHIALPHGR
mmetsp:Transcript_40953/g.121423  ORF Transcript_40953/g.121423 Transcript_40953/m.121423 type:complete len:691 (+) Transcript_40953:250-2322(+)